MLSVALEAGQQLGRMLQEHRANRRIELTPATAGGQLLHGSQTSGPPVHLGDQRELDDAQTRRDFLAPRPERVIPSQRASTCDSMLDTPADTGRRLASATACCP